MQSSSDISPSLAPSITLSSGTTLPVIGLGVYKIPQGEPTEQTVLWALSAGYRHIDTASFYGNEASVGAAIRKSGVPREEIFLTTKLWPTDFFRAEKACAESLKKREIDALSNFHR
jgi:diketogulonate reductase-like aldo/keto reductase